MSAALAGQPDEVPPLASDQWLPSLQLPVPPTQYKFLDAIPLIVQPVLLPRLMALLAVKDAPPVTAISFKFTYAAVTVPDAMLIVARLPAVPELILMSELQLPLDTVIAVVIVCVVPELKV